MACLQALDQKELEDMMLRRLMETSFKEELDGLS